MKVVNKISQVSNNRVFRSLALGNFDGVHLGHRFLIDKAVRKAKEKNGCSVVFSFVPHPLIILKGAMPPVLTSQTEKEALIASSGVDYFLRYPFDRDLAKMEPEAFVRDILLDELHANHIFVGFNHSFGAHGRGNAELLQEICTTVGCMVSIVQPVSSPYGIVSSTLIRAKLMAGDIRVANELLGYYYSLSGKVIYGDQIGRTIGFPTANLEVAPERAIPAYGVYAGYLADQEIRLPAVINIGIRPTVSNTKELRIEAHCLDYSGDLYGHQVSLSFIERLRGEIRFNGISELKAQITADCMAARQVLAKEEPAWRGKSCISSF